ncbi:MAG: carboxypeptidase-like regulatory domain-containing protein [Niabella sp.]
MNKRDGTYYDETDIRRYLKGEMDARQMHDLERAALDDPFLSDAIEGYRLADDKLAEQHLEEIKTYVEAGQAQGKVVMLRSWMRWLAAAAVIGVMAVAAWWFTQQKDDKVPVLTDNRQSVAQPEYADTVNKLQKEDTITEHSAREEAVTLPPKIGEATLKNPSASSSAPVMASKPLKPAEAAPPVVTEAVRPDVSLAATDSKVLSDADLSRRLQGRVAGVSVRQDSFKGVVTDNTGRPVSYASVTIDEKNGTMTDAEGRFSLPRKDSAQRVTISGVGYEYAKATLSPNKLNTVQLEKAENNLDEVVVVGYGQQKKRAIVGAASARNIAYSQNASPVQGWNKFYKELRRSIQSGNVNQTDSLLQLQVFLQNGMLKEYKVISATDSATVRDAVQYIKTVNWKNVQPNTPVYILLKLK